MVEYPSFKNVISTFYVNVITKRIHSTLQLNTTIDQIETSQPLMQTMLVCYYEES